MAQIILKTNTPEKAADVLKEALEIEASRLKYSLNIAKKRLKRFETKYNISSEKFMRPTYTIETYLRGTWQALHLLATSLTIKRLLSEGGRSKSRLLGGYKVEYWCELLGTW